MDSLLIILGIVCLVVGFFGSFLPVLPGTGLSWLGLLFLHFTERVEFSTTFLVVTAVVVVIVNMLDYMIPIWGSKKFGGTDYGKKGAIAGVIVGVFLGPLGIILGPFLGAIVGELIHNSTDFKKAFRSGLGAFFGFMLGTGIKMIVCLVFVFYFVRELI